jgi:hypothetical protein
MNIFFKIQILLLFFILIVYIFINHKVFFHKKKINEIEKLIKKEKNKIKYLSCLIKNKIAESYSNKFSDLNKIKKNQLLILDS